MDPERGALRDLVSDDRLDTREKLISLLAQVIFIAGPGHASQHYSSNYFYRYAPAFPGAAYQPPLWRNERANEARFENLLPPIATAARQVQFNTFTNYRYDRFGHYAHHPLGRVAEAQEPIRRLQAKLAAIEGVIRERNESREVPYGFLLPSLVPNSVNM
jgi:arachidonate 15-lipoxygenase